MGLLWVLGYKVWPKLPVIWGLCPHFHVESSGFDMLKLAENTQSLGMIQDITEEMVLFSMAMSKSCGVTQWLAPEEKILLLQGSWLRKTCQGISLIWAKIRHIHEPLGDAV